MPDPQPTRDGARSAVVESSDHAWRLPVVLFSWLEGRDLGGKWTTQQAHAVGAAMATLHDHAERWTMPAGAEFSGFESVLTDLPNRLADHPSLDAATSALLMEAMAQAQQLQDEVFAAGPVLPLHADLHGGNLKWLNGSLSIFDFDDAGYGPPGLDLAITAYYLRDSLAIEEAIRAGYASVRALPEVTTAQFEAMVAGRNLLLINDVIEQPNAELQAIVPRYVANSVLRLRSWLDTGRYRREVPGVTT